VRYLVVSDLHYGLTQFDWVADNAADYDAVVFGGDHLDVVGRVDIGTQIAMVSAFFEELAGVTTVIVNSGNHDLTERLEHGEKAATWLGALDPRVHVDGATIAVGDDLMSVCAWWEGPVTKALLLEQLDRAAEQRPESGRWIWAYHSPPDRSATSWSGSRHFGDDVLNELIGIHQPDLVLTGHVHESPFVPDGSWHDTIGTTVVLNAGRQIGPIPTHIVVDTGSGELGWWSLEGSEQARL
jgi:Icc-related predicted phosphoesterase